MTKLELALNERLALLEALRIAKKYYEEQAKSFRHSASLYPEYSKPLAGLGDACNDQSREVEALITLVLDSELICELVAIGVKK